MAVAAVVGVRLATRWQAAKIPIHWEPPPTVPKERPASARIRNAIVKQLLAFGARVAAEQLIGEPAGLVVSAADAVWVAEEYGPYIDAYFDAPRSLEELQQAANERQRGYDIHHIVEQTPAEQDGFPRSLIDGSENLVRIPTFKHWQVTGWFGTPNEDYGWQSPREFLRGKNWTFRVDTGKKALIEVGVLKP